MSDPLPMTADALLLDMDGTLVDSGAAVTRSWNRLFEDMGSTARFGDAHHGVPARQVLSREFPDLSESELAEVTDRIEQIELGDTEGVEILPGTERLLSELDACSAQLCRPCWTIVTSCTRALFDARWAVTGLPVPATIVTADQVIAGKPDPEPYLLGAERLGVDPAEAIVLEDALGGLASARAAGCRAIALSTNTPAAALAGHAALVVTSVDDLSVTVDDGRLLVARRGA